MHETTQYGMIFEFSRTSRHDSIRTHIHTNTSSTQICIERDIQHTHIMHVCALNRNKIQYLQFTYTQKDIYKKLYIPTPSYMRRNVVEMICGILYKEDEGASTSSSRRVNDDVCC